VDVWEWLRLTHETHLLMKKNEIRVKNIQMEEMIKKIN